MTHRLRLALLFSLLAPLSCGGESASVGDYIDGADRYARSVCECDYNSLALLFAGKTPYGSTEECLADLPANSAERGCVEGLFDEVATDYSAVLDCRASVYSRGASCLDARTCTDTARLDCYEDITDDIEDCPDLPDDVEQRLNDCLYN